MGRIFVYKIGNTYLNSSTEDKNSAKWEIKKIKDIASRYYGNKNILLLVGGLANQKDKEFIEYMFQHGNFDYKVFVMTDTGSLALMEYVNRCDLLLHQSMIPIEGCNTKQMYGYMPEMFMDSEYPAFQQKNNVVLFGGNNLNRDEELRHLCFDRKGNVNNGMFLLLKNYETGLDARIDHSTYIRLLSMSKYSLVFSSPWIYEHGWITARMIEAFACGNIPLVSVGYDSYHAYCHTWTTVLCYNDIRKILNGYNEQEIAEELKENTACAKSRANKFEEILLNL